jgi:S-adenosyl methyltransferase
VSEVAQEIDPAVHVVHVDNDPMVFTHSKALRGSGRWREDQDIIGWFGDWELLEPGWVPLAEWRPAVRGRTLPDEVYHSFFGGVARRK